MPVGHGFSCAALARMLTYCCPWPAPAQHLEEVGAEAALLRATLERAQEGWSPGAQDFVALERKLAALQVGLPGG